MITYVEIEYFPPRVITEPLPESTFDVFKAYYDDGRVTYQQIAPLKVSETLGLDVNRAIFQAPLPDVLASFAPGTKLRLDGTLPSPYAWRGQPSFNLDLTQKVVKVPPGFYLYLGIRNCTTTLLAHPSDGDSKRSRRIRGSGQYAVLTRIIGDKEITSYMFQLTPAQVESLK